MSSESVIALFWDIDGTLLSTDRAGLYAIEEAAELIFGKAVDLQDIKTAGLTDIEIAAKIISEGGVEATDEKVDKFLRHYEKRLPDNLPRKTGKVFEGIVPILEAIKDDDRFFSILLTGNTRMGANAKLNHYKLIQYFDIENGAFSNGSTCREDIAEDAFRRFKEAHPNAKPEQSFVIGDTQHDIRCGKAINANVIGVGTGSTTAEELEELGAWWAVPQLPSPEAFIDKVLTQAACK